MMKIGTMCSTGKLLKYLKIHLQKKLIRKDMFKNHGIFPNLSHYAIVEIQAVSISFQILLHVFINLEKRSNTRLNVLLKKIRDANLRLQNLICQEVSIE